MTANSTASRLPCTTDATLPAMASNSCANVGEGRTGSEDEVNSVGAAVTA
jgi:hypothetical protein